MNGMSDEKRARLFSDAMHLIDEIGSIAPDTMAMLNERGGNPPLSALQRAEAVLRSIRAAEKHAFSIVAELAEEYTRQGGDPR